MRKRMWRRATAPIASMTLCIGLFINYLAAFSDNTQSDASELRAAIDAFAPGSAILSAAEVDPVGCNPLGQSPGLVRADLNGDGQNDYAALLKLPEGNARMK